MRPAGLAVTLTTAAELAVADPDAGATLNHDPPLDVATLAENCNRPLPAFEILNCRARTPLGWLGKVNVSAGLSTASLGFALLDT